MTQYDAGPGDWSDRPWEDPDHKQKPQARRRRVALPPWALLVIFVAIIILLCVSLVLIVRAIRGRDDEGTATPVPTLTVAATAVQTPGVPATPAPLTPTAVVSPTSTAALPIEGPEASPTPSAIGPGTIVLVEGTSGAGLNLREQPSTYSAVMGNVPDGTELTVLEGPQDADGYVWWNLQAPDGTEGWGAANWLVLKTGE
jgi:hypothetical protein